MSPVRLQGLSPPVLPAQPVMNDLLTLPLAQVLESVLVDGYLGPDADAAALSGS